jgi:two-component system CheB/CheR fusion protein
LLKRFTAMSVREARDAVSIEPDHVYIIPPTKNIYFTGGILELQDLERRPGESHTADLFFKSLAEQLHEKAIGVILSGTGNDGVAGARAIKPELGMVIVQDPQSAKCDGMPRAAIAGGVADYVLPPDAMPAQIIQYVQQTRGAAAENRRETMQRDVSDLQRIFTVIRARTKHDFPGYKLSTINRRIEPRMGVNQIQSLAEYANEEYQATNEEPETSREELQSLNEELMTINNECQTKIDQLSVINDDMKNLLNCTNVGTVFLDDKLRIKRFTPAATDIFNLIESDIGRPIDHVTSELLTYPGEKLSAF